MNILVLHSNSYNFNDIKTGNQIKGIKLKYAFTDDLSPLIVDSNEKGFQVAESSIPYECLDNITKVPGIYNANFVTKVIKNQPVQKLVNVEFICTVPELYINSKVDNNLKTDKKAV